MTANFASIWERHAERYAERPAVIDPSATRTWSQFNDRAARLANAFASAGIAPGANVGLCLFNCNAYSESQFALFKQRATPFNINYRYRTTELSDLLTNSDAEAIVFDAAIVAELEPIVEQLRGLKLVVQVDTSPPGSPAAPVPEWAVSYEALIAGNEPAAPIERSTDDLWILFTGGTTGHPKGVMWPHASIVGLMRRNLAELDREVPADAAGFSDLAEVFTSLGATGTQLAAAPLMHGTSGLIALQTLSLAGTVVSLSPGSFDAAELWSTVQRTNATTISIVGDAFARPMLDALDAASDRGEPYRLPALRRIASSGVMWSAEVKAGMLRHLDVDLADLLGSSEGAGIATKVANRETEATTAKFALSEQAQVFDDAGEPVKPGSGQVGHVAVGGPLPLGYYGDPDKSARTWREIGGKRWCLAGDMATVEADGSITLLGRGSNCINTGGEKVFPEEVEEALKAHPDVVDASAIGVADERWGQRVTAVISLRPEGTASDDELIAFAKASLAAYKAPKQLVRVDRFVRKPNGKPDYAWARAEVEGAG